MSDTDRTDERAIELEEHALDAISGGMPASVKVARATIWTDGNITGTDDWEKHNV